MWKNIIAIIKIEGKESLIEQARWCRMILRLVPSKQDSLPPRIYPNKRPSYPRHPGRFLTGTRQSTFQPLLFNYSGISWKSSIASWGAFPARRVLRIRQLIDRQPGTGQRGMKPAGRVERGRGMAEGGGVASRATL